MKKMRTITVVLILSVLTMVGTAIQASAAQTFVDNLDDYFSYIVDKSAGWQIEKNEDILSENNKDPMLYSKNGNAKKDGNGKAKGTEWLVYKMTGDITAFKIHTYNCAGFGDSSKDVQIDVSKDNKTWTKIETSVSPQVFDEDLYFNKDKAYWFQSDVTNKGSIPSGNVYLKFTLLPFSNAENGTAPPSWATVLHSVSITHNGTTDPPKSTSSAAASSSSVAASSKITPTSSTVAPTSSTATPTSSAVTSSTVSEVSSDSATESVVSDVTSADTIESEDSTAAEGTSSVISSASSAGKTDKDGSIFPIWGIALIAAGVVALAGGGFVLWKFVISKKK